jgi:pantothenate kinase
MHQRYSVTNNEMLIKEWWVQRFSKAIESLRQAIASCLHHQGDAVKFNALSLASSLLMSVFSCR